MLEINKIYNEDCLEGMKKIDDKSIDTIITDLPYGQTSRNKWDSVIPFKPLWEQYERIIKDNGAIILFANGMFTADLMQSNRKLWKYNLIWEKTQPTGFLNAKKMPLRSHEDICIFYKKLPTYNPQKTTGHPRKVSKAEHKTNCKETTDYGEHGLTTYDSTERYPKSVWTFAKDIQKSALHPTQKPVSLIEELIKTYTNPGDLVLDSCAGSCTTAVAALNVRGHEVYSVEWNKDFENIDLYADISQVTAQDILEKFGHPDVIWASPDCTTFSIAAISHHRRKNPETGNLDPISDYAKFCDATDQHVISLIKELNPTYYFIENPRGGMRKMTWMQDLPRYTVTYCKYGDTRMKPTDIWTNPSESKISAYVQEWGSVSHTSSKR